MFWKNRINVSICTIIFLFLSGCGGGSGSDGGEPEEPQQKYSVIVDSSYGGITNLFVSDNHVYFNEYNSGQIQKVNIGDGIVKNVYSDSRLSPRYLYDYGGILYFMTSVSNGGVYSIADNAEGMTTLVEGTGHAILDVYNDDTYAYWVSEGQLLRTPLSLTSEGGKLETELAEVLFEATSENRLRVVLDDKFIFASESLTGDIYKISTSDRHVEFLANLPATDTLSFFDEIPLFVTADFLYALVNEKNIYCIAKDGSSSRLVVTGSFNSDRLSAETDGLYWLDGFLGVLKKIQDTSATIVEITEDPSIRSSQVFLLPADGASVYWAVVDQLYGEVKIYSAPKNGGDAVLVSEFDSEFATNGVVVADRSDFYWVANHSVVRVGKNGEEPTLILRNPGAGARLSMYDGHILIGDTKGVRIIPKTGQAMLTKEWEFPYERSIVPKYMTGERDILYLLGQSGPTGTFEVYSFDLNSKESKILASLDGTGISIIPYRDSLFVLGEERRSVGGGTITVVPKNGIDFEPITMTWPEKITGIYERDGVLYFLSDGTVYFVEIDTQDIYPSEDLPDEANALLVEDEYVYWMSGDSVFRIPQGGGRLETLFSGNLCYDIEADEHYIYVAAGFKLVKIPKH